MKVLRFEGFGVSVNEWKDARGMRVGNRVTAQMYKTTKYRGFIDTLIAHYFVQQSPRIEGYIDVGLKICAWRRVDSDAYIKAIFDSMEKGFIVKTDNRIRCYNIERAYHKQGEFDTIIIDAFKCKARLCDWATNAIDIPEANSWATQIPLSL